MTPNYAMFSTEQLRVINHITHHPHAGVFAQLAICALLLPLCVGTVTVSLPLSATAVAAGDFHTCALLANGAVRCWGQNWFGQLGDGTTTNRTTPATVSGLSGATAVTAGGYHTCARLTDGTVRCWGWNYFGQLGDGTTTRRSTPATVSGLSGATAVTAGGYHTCALLGDGTVRCWGWNNYGQLGNGDPIYVTQPVVVRTFFSVFIPISRRP